jgi:Formin Homology 2 Domain
VDTKAATENTTLLHFLAKVVEEKLPRVNDFVEDLKDCDLACKGKIKSRAISIFCEHFFALI